MANKYEAELTGLANKIQAVIDEANSLPGELGAVKNRVVGDSTVLMNRVKMLAGMTVGTTEQAKPAPLTHILGELINRPQPVTAEKLAPTNEEKERFLAERDSLYSQFLTLTDEQIGSKRGMPNGESVIRAVAKKAGVADYSTAKINVKFIEKMRTAIIAENEAAQKLKDAEQSLKDTEAK